MSIVVLRGVCTVRKSSYHDGSDAEPRTNPWSYRQTASDIGLAANAFVAVVLRSLAIKLLPSSGWIWGHPFSCVSPQCYRSVRVIFFSLGSFFTVSTTTTVPGYVLLSTCCESQYIVLHADISILITHTFGALFFRDHPHSQMSMHRCSVCTPMSPRPHRCCPHATVENYCPRLLVEEE